MCCNLPVHWMQEHRLRAFETRSVEDTENCIIGNVRWDFRFLRRREWILAWDLESGRYRQTFHRCLLPPWVMMEAVSSHETSIKKAARCAWRNIVVERRRVVVGFQWFSMSYEVVFTNWPKHILMKNTTGRWIQSLTDLMTMRPTLGLILASGDAR